MFLGNLRKNGFFGKEEKEEEVEEKVVEDLGAVEDDDEQDVGTSDSDGTSEFSEPMDFSMEKESFDDDSTVADEVKPVYEEAVVDEVEEAEETAATLEKSDTVVEQNVKSQPEVIISEEELFNRAYQVHRKTANGKILKRVVFHEDIWPNKNEIQKYLKDEDYEQYLLLTGQYESESNEIPDEEKVASDTVVSNENNRDETLDEPIVSEIESEESCVGDDVSNEQDIVLEQQSAHYEEVIENNECYEEHGFTEEVKQTAENKDVNSIDELNNDIEYLDDEVSDRIEDDISEPNNTEESKGEESVADILDIVDDVVEPVEADVVEAEQYTHTSSIKNTEIDEKITECHIADDVNQVVEEQNKKNQVKGIQITEDMEIGEQERQLLENPLVLSLLRKSMYVDSSDTSMDEEILSLSKDEMFEQLLRVNGILRKIPDILKCADMIYKDETPREVKDLIPQKRANQLILDFLEEFRMMKHMEYGTEFDSEIMDRFGITSDEIELAKVPAEGGRNGYSLEVIRGETKKIYRFVADGHTFTDMCRIMFGLEELASSNASVRDKSLNVSLDVVGYLKACGIRAVYEYTEADTIDKINFRYDVDNKKLDIMD